MLNSSYSHFTAEEVLAMIYERFPEFSLVASFDNVSDEIEFRMLDEAFNDPFRCTRSDVYLALAETVDEDDFINAIIGSNF